jgi:hypothetical protein
LGTLASNITVTLPTYSGSARTVIYDPLGSTSVFSITFACAGGALYNGYNTNSVNLFKPKIVLNVQNSNWMTSDYMKASAAFSFTTVSGSMSFTSIIMTEVSLVSSTVIRTRSPRPLLFDFDSGSGISYTVQNSVDNVTWNTVYSTTSSTSRSYPTNSPGVFWRVNGVSLLATGLLTITEI